MRTTFRALVGFVVLDMDEGSEVPLILCCPFVATARTTIDIGTSELVLSVGTK